MRFVQRGVSQSNGSRSDMLDNIFFRAWVANTCWELSGIWSYDWRGLSRKRALTFAEIRMVACQEVNEPFFDDANRAFMRVTSEVVTNKRVLH